MKTAMLFHGQPRFLDSCYSEIKTKILDVYNPDVYCQAWWSENETIYDGSDQKKYPVERDVPKKINLLYQPKSVLIEESWTEEKLFKEYPDLLPYKMFPGYYHFLSQFISLYKVSKLLKWDDYDFIIKWRYDVLPVNFPDLTKLDTKYLYAFTDKHHSHHNKETWADAVFLLGPNMRGVFEIIPFLIKNNNKLNIDFIYNLVPENIFHFYTKQENISKNVITLPIEVFTCLISRGEDLFE